MDNRKAIAHWKTLGKQIKVEQINSISAGDINSKNAKDLKNSSDNETETFNETEANNGTGSLVIVD